MIRVKFGEEQVEFPSLVVLIGRNGSGKSRLLSNIQKPNGSKPKENLVALKTHKGNWRPANSIRLQELADGYVPRWPTITTPLAPEDDVSDRRTLPARNAARALRNAKHNLSSNLRTKLMSRFGGGVTNRFNPSMISLSTEALAKQLEIYDSEEGIAYVAECLDDLEAELYKTANSQRELLEADFSSYTLMTGKSLRESTEDDVLQFAKRPKQKAFQFDIESCIRPYRAALFENIMREIDDRQSGERTARSPEEFLEHFGEPPWETLSDALEEFGLPYRLTTPPRDPRKPYSPKLLNKMGTELDPAALSSGEKVLFNFALSLMDFDERQMSFSFPDLLLLDEVDASLDPANLQLWLNGITSSLVDRVGTKVILATHSPITVALAPEDSLYEMVADGRPPVKIDRQQAIDQLTIGLPTLSVDPDSQRQVFTESGSDVRIYQTLVSKVKGVVEMDLSLHFLRTGVDAPKGETNAGCAVVRSIVSELRKGGNRSVRGVIDWDGVNTSADGVHVVGEGTHYAIENILLDPLLVAALLIIRSEHPTYKHSFVTLQKMGDAELQKLADELCPSVPDQGAKTRIQYIDGRSINVPTSLLTMNGHGLEEIWKNAHPSLRYFHGGLKGTLPQAVVQHVIGQLSEFCPKSLGDLLTGLAKADPG